MPFLVQCTCNDCGQGFVIELSSEIDDELCPCCDSFNLRQVISNHKGVFEEYDYKAGEV